MSHHIHLWHHGAPGHHAGGGSRVFWFLLGVGAASWYFKRRAMKDGGSWGRSWRRCDKLESPPAAAAEEAPQPEGEWMFSARFGSSPAAAPQPRATAVPAPVSTTPPAATPADWEQVDSERFMSGQPAEKDLSKAAETRVSSSSKCHCSEVLTCRLVHSPCSSPRRPSTPS
jgi:hypothetical protein